MNRNILILLTFVGLIGILSGCEKDETKVVLSTNPVAPTLTVPDLTLERANGNDMVVFTGTPVKPGFVASTNYFLEACAQGNNFKDSILILTDKQDAQMKISVSDLNSLLLKSFPADQVSTLDFRIRAVLVQDAGTGVKPPTYVSETQTADVTLYGLPRLDLLNSGMDQKIESALGDGSYTGLVKLDPNNPFTLKDPDANVVYGGSGGNLVVDGSGIAADQAGWYQLDANTNDLTYDLNPHMIGVIGDFNGWSAPDTKMDYNPEGDYWHVTVDLTPGGIKFRMNDSWSDGINLGIGDADHPEYTLDNLWNNGSSQNIPISSAGSYSIKLYIGTSTYKCTITKN